MTKLDPQTARQIAKDGLPVLQFDTLERWFPVRAEAWIGHVSCAPWEHDPDDIAALPVDTHRRGTAICTSDEEVKDVVRVAGAPNPEDRPLRIAKDGPDAIGDKQFVGQPNPKNEQFMTFAGWKTSDAWDGGDLDYLYDAFSELSSAINKRQAWQPLPRARSLDDPADRGGLPYFAHQQPTSPAVYCEVDWAGVHPRRSTAQLLGDFPAGMKESKLDGFMQVTYYYFFPAREPLRQQPNTERIEGQWAAVSLFYEATPSEARDAKDRPTSIDFVTERGPRYVAFSLDPERPPGSKPVSIVRRFSSSELDLVAIDDSQPVRVKVWVGCGSHRLFPKQNPETVLEDPEDWPDLDYPPGSDYELIVPLIVVLGLLAAIAAVILALGLAIAVASALVGMGVALGAAIAAGLAAALVALLAALLVIIVILVVIVLLYLLFKALSELWDDDASQEDIPPSQDAPVTPGTSTGDPGFGEPAQHDPATTGETQPAGWSDPDPALPAGSNTTGWWPTNEGSPEGWDATYFDMTVMTRLRSAAEKDPSLAPPPWWDYTGRWGIRIRLPESSAWHSGTRRSSLEGSRSWAYWHAHELLNHLHPPPTQP